VYVLSHKLKVLTEYLLRDFQRQRQRQLLANSPSYFILNLVLSYEDFCKLKSATLQAL
jgi:hypothetical protein